MKLIILLIITCAAGSTKKILRILGFQPMTGNKGWLGGPACLPGIMMALKDVQNHEGILDDYQLSYKWIDTQCDAGTAVYKMSNSLHRDPPYVMLLGAGCSTSSESTAQVSHFWNLTQLSSGSASPILSDRDRFPRFFRLGGPDQTLNPSRIALMDTFNWNKVATIGQAIEFFSVVIDDFVKIAHASNKTIVSQEIFEHDPMSRVKNLKNHDARIVFVACYEDMARKILCAAYKLGHFGPKIVWLLFSWYSEFFWRTNLDKESVGCTVEEMEKVIEGSFLFGYVFRNPVEERGIANITAKEFDERLIKDEMYDATMSHFDYAAGGCYDHLWIAALALNCTDTVLKNNGHLKSLDMFSYGDSDINEVIFECMGNTSYIGVTGKIMFDGGADPRKNVYIQRIQDGEREHVGLYNMDASPMYFQWITNGIRWQGIFKPGDSIAKYSYLTDGNIPRDSTYVTREEVLIPPALYITLTSLACFGIMIAASLFAFNVKYKNNRIVKMSSPNINNLLLLGCVLCYSTVFIKTTGTSNATFCWARTFCFALGFTLSFGALFSKTWRVYRIFTNKSLSKRTMKDYQLVAIILSLVGVVLVVLVTWEIVAPHTVITSTLYKEVYMTGNDAEIQPFIRICHSEHSVQFGWTFYIIEGALLSFGAFLAWETRHVKIEALNDSRQIGLCLYNVVILSVVGLTFSLLLSQHVVMLYGITSACIIIGTTVTQIVVFLPKVHVVFTKVDTNDSTSNTRNVNPTACSDLSKVV